MEITRENHDGDDTTRLYYASAEGSISSLNTLIQKDPLILRRVSLTTLTETPLHVSALLGHLEFSKILLTHNPKLATELDSLRRLPLHLASAEGHKEVVQALLIANPDACLHRDQQGRIPLHYAAMRGRLEVVKELMCAKPQSITLMVLDESGGTTLHLCVQYNHLDCLKYLVEEVGKNSNLLISRADSSAGITILRLAIMLKQVETIKYLLSLAIIREEANDMLFNTLEQGPRDFRSLEIQQILMDAGIKRNQKLQTNENDEKVLSSTPSNSTFVKKTAHELMTWLRRGLRQCIQYNKGDRWLEETRGMLMVVATMISTMTFQAGINPPGGVWQDNFTNKTAEGGENIVCSETNECIAGTAVLAYVWTDDMLQFMKYNTISFFFSLCVTILLVSGFPLTNRTCVWLLSMAMCVTITFAGLTFLEGVYLVMPYSLANHVQEKYRPIGIDVWKALLGMVGTFHTIRFLYWLGKKVNSVFRYKRPNMSIEEGRTIEMGSMHARS